MISGLERSPQETVLGIIERLVFTKSEEWAYEQEYRLFVPYMIEPNQQFTTFKFHSEELTGIYCGCRMQEDEIRQIQISAEKINPTVKLYRSRLRTH